MSGYVCYVIQQCYGSSPKNSKAGKTKEQGECRSVLQLMTAHMKAYQTEQ
jgi:hypothetical protein